jgi:hypothetical protein
MKCIPKSSRHTITQSLSTSSLEQFDELDFAFANQFVILRDAPKLSALLEVVKVAAGPTEHSLKRVIQTAEQHRSRNLNSSPDRWLNLDERNLQPVNGRRCLGRRYMDVVEGLQDWRRGSGLN